MFSESSTANNDPLFNIGTHSQATDGSVDFFFRRSGWATVDHLRSVGQPLDGTWRHLVFVQQEDGSRALYVDGVQDGIALPAKEAGDWNVNTTSIGGILRANPSHWLTGAIDEVALWSRALSPTEIQQVNSEGLTSVFPPLTRGMVAYWPLDEVLGVTTPDIASGYDLELRNLTAADLVPGKAGQAFQFDNTRQTMLARVHSAGEQLPINQHPALTISFWANVKGTGLTDLRMFSESNTGNNNPLFNIGTASDSLSDKVDFYIRQTGWTDVNHVRTDGDPLDGTWRHLVFVQQEDGTRTFYVDAVEDLVGGLLTPKPVGGDTNNWNLNATSIGGILRANPSHWLTGTIDDVALWSRALEPAEITSLFQDGTPVPFTRAQPLAVRSFEPDFPAVAVGDSVTLRWDVTKNVKVEIDLIGDVTAQTVAGLGSIEVTLPSTRTFNMTLTRGEETVSQSLTVYAIGGVAEGWTLIDNFDRYNLGLLNGQGGWGDLDAADFSVIEHNGNRFVAPHAAEAVAVLNLGPQTIVEGQERTLFFRAYLIGDPLIEGNTINTQVAVTDRRLRFGNEAGDNVGPGALITDADTPTFRYVGGYIGWNPASRDIGTFENPELLPDKAWNVWVDFNNGPFQYDNAAPPVAINTGDLYSIHVAEEGTAQRFTVFSDQIASRNPIGQADTGFTTQDLDRLIIGAIAGHGSLTNLFIDDIYLSKAGYNSTVPRPFGFTTPVVEADPPVMDIQLSGSDISITWDRGVLESTDAIGGTWALVPGATSPYTPPIDGAQRFYRASD